MTPNIEKAASIPASGRSSACPSITFASTLAGADAAIRATMPGEKSVARTCAPVRAAASASAPAPAATSSTRMSGVSVTRASASSAKRDVKGWAVRS